ncbi:AAA family ATPase [Nocardioides soli]|uniref:Putative kinase n=1 Tax=Nocardioides soli TaxID=1036020 RepID=A0A7W4VSU1_9ACTN|nr:AAA family ATPase [Nocardioides soli]MBB3041010.1 putative kinase [Nocardioides soli]
MLTVITGPPCAGKTTYVADHRDPGDLVIDLDAIAHALGYPSTHVEWNDQHPALAAARTVRQVILDQALRASAATWLIEAKPHPTSRRIYQRHGARIVDLDPGRAVCHQRAEAAGRSAGTRQQIDRWYGVASTNAPALDLFG